MQNSSLHTYGSNSLSRHVIGCELAVFILLLVVIWLNELIDIPHLFFMAPKSPINWREALFESVIIVPLGFVLTGYTRRLFSRLKYLEGLLPICASCKKIRDDHGDWHVIEAYIGQHSDATFSHGLCPHCAHKLYPDVFPDNDTPECSEEKE